MSGTAPGLPGPSGPHFKGKASILSGIQTFQPQSRLQLGTPSHRSVQRTSGADVAHFLCTGMRSAPKLEPLGSALHDTMRSGERPRSSRAHVTGSARSNAPHDSVAGVPVTSRPPPEAHLGEKWQKHDKAVNALRNRVVKDDALPFVRRVVATRNDPAQNTSNTPKATESTRSTMHTARYSKDEARPGLEAVSAVPFRLALVRGCVPELCAVLHSALRLGRSIARRLCLLHLLMWKPS